MIPKKYEAYETPEKQKVNTAFYRLLSGFKGKSENVFYLETAGTNNGDMKEGDADFLNKVLPPEADILSTGGFIGSCLMGTSRQIQKLNGKRRVTIDFSESNDSGDYTMSAELYKLPPLKLPKNPEAIRSYADVQKILKENKSYREAYDKAIFNIRINSNRYSDPDEAEFYFRNQR